MSRKYPKRVRKELQRQQAAAAAFVKEWTHSGLASGLIDDYSCTLTCGEAETYSGLFRSFGYHGTADSILADHGEDCDTPHYHAKNGVWTFTIAACGPAVAEVEDPEWVIVADGKNGAEAEDRAESFLRRQLAQKYPGYFYVSTAEVEDGVPSSTALYHWIDLRKAA
ncbi:hypothetical protein ACWEVY_28785 [Streptomyces longwoodensis]